MYVFISAQTNAAAGKRPEHRCARAGPQTADARRSGCAKKIGRTQKGPLTEVTLAFVPSGTLRGPRNSHFLGGGMSPRCPHREKHSGHFSFGALLCFIEQGARGAGDVCEGSGARRGRPSPRNILTTSVVKATARHIKRAMLRGNRLYNTTCLTHGVFEKW